MCPFAPTVCPFPTVSDRHCVRLQPPCVRFLLCPIGPVSDCNHRVSVSYCVRLAMCPIAIVSDCHCVRLQPPCVRLGLCPIYSICCVRFILCATGPHSNFTNRTESLISY